MVTNIFFKYSTKFKATENEQWEKKLVNMSVLYILVNLI